MEQVRREKNQEQAVAWGTVLQVIQTDPYHFPEEVVGVVAGAGRRGIPILVEILDAQTQSLLNKHFRKGEKMPGMDGTGPMGTGPIGRGMGPCGGGLAGWGRGRGLRRGAGAGWGMMPATLPPVDENTMLEQQKEWLETQISTITQRLQDLEKNSDKE